MARRGARRLARAAGDDLRAAHPACLGLAALRPLVAPRDGAVHPCGPGAPRGEPDPGRRVGGRDLAARRKSGGTLRAGKPPDEISATRRRTGSAARPAPLPANRRRWSAARKPSTRAASSARIDLGVLLSDLPQAESQARAAAESIRAAGLAAHEQSASLEGHLAALSARGREADETLGGAAQRLGAQVARLETARARRSSGSTSRRRR